MYSVPIKNELLGLISGYLVLDNGIHDVISALANSNYNIRLRPTIKDGKIESVVFERDDWHEQDQVAIPVKQVLRGNTTSRAQLLVHKDEYNELLHSQGELLVSMHIEGEKIKALGIYSRLRGMSHWKNPQTNQYHPTPRGWTTEHFKAARRLLSTSHFFYNEHTGEIVASETSAWGDIKEHLDDMKLLEIV